MIQKKVFDELDKDPLSSFNSTIISFEKDFKTYEKDSQPIKENPPLTTDDNPL